jgi:hypothetical protein
MYLSSAGVMTAPRAHLKLFSVAIINKSDSGPHLRQTHTHQSEYRRKGVWAYTHLPTDAKAPGLPRHPSLPGGTVLQRSTDRETPVRSATWPTGDPSIAPAAPVGSSLSGGRGPIHMPAQCRLLVVAADLGYHESRQTTGAKR